MARIQSWEVSDSFWEKVEPLIPPPERDPNKAYERKSGDGRNPIASRKTFEAILFVCAAHRLPIAGFAKGVVR